MNPSALPPDLQRFAALVESEPENVRELFHYALAMLMVENGKAKIMREESVAGQTQLSLKTIAGDEFTLVKPPVKKELLEQMQRMAQEIWEEEQTDGDAPSAV